jgi:hypothetical protein
MGVIRRVRRLLKRTRNKGELKRVWQNRQVRNVDADKAAAEIEKNGIHPESFLFITLDSCRYDTFANANCPNLKSVGDLIEAEAPATFTLPSHVAMFVGLTPRVAKSDEPFINPGLGRIFRLLNRVAKGNPNDYLQMEGRSIIAGFNGLGYRTIGAAAMRWFDPTVPTGVTLTEDFQEFRYTGTDVEAQMKFVLSAMSQHLDEKLFVFINTGETHTPYRHRGAPWPNTNPCVRNKPGHPNNTEDCTYRQTKCLEFCDEHLAPLLDIFKKAGASMLVCGDHGDCHGEDGLWGHTIYHDKVMKVPMLFHLRPREKAQHFETTFDEHEGSTLPKTA